MSCEEAAGVVERWGPLVQALQEFATTTVEELDGLITQLLTKLHPKHYMVTELQLEVVKRMSRGSEGAKEATREGLERMVEVVEGLLEVMRVVHPGRTKWRGLLLYELGETLIMLAGLVEERSASRLRTVVDVLEEGVRCLEHDPETTNEGQVCQKMNDFLETLYLSHRV